MAGWRVSIEEKADGYVLLWYSDAPGGSSQILRTFDSWDEAIGELESVRAGYVEEYRTPAEVETPEKPEPAVETPEKPSRSTKATRKSQ